MVYSDEATTILTQGEEIALSFFNLMPLLFKPRVRQGDPFYSAHRRWKTSRGGAAAKECTATALSIRGDFYKFNQDLSVKSCFIE